jgi:hypothetical protein
VTARAAGIGLFAVIRLIRPNDARPFGDGVVTWDQGTVRDPAALSGHTASDRTGSTRGAAMIGLTGEIQPRIQFVFYLLALLAFVVAAVVPADRMPGALARVNLVAAGLALAIAPSVYVYFKVGFHQGALFH